MGEMDLPCAIVDIPLGFCLHFIRGSFASAGFAVWSLVRRVLFAMSPEGSVFPLLLCSVVLSVGFPSFLPSKPVTKTIYTCV